MARMPRRILREHRLFHVTARGAARARIALDEHDYARLQGRLERVARKYAWKVHAFCVMPNHLHLVVECDLALLSKGMQEILGPYAQGFNRRHGRWGHLWGERFHARAIRDDEHLEQAVPYVFDNPVRALLAKTRDAWPWSGLLDGGRLVRLRAPPRPTAGVSVS